MGRELRVEHWEPPLSLEIETPTRKTEKEQLEVGEEPRETGVIGAGDRMAERDH